MFFGLARLYLFLTDDFRLANISYNMPYHAEWEIHPLSATEKQKLDAIFNQPFSYIGKGAQSYVFGSHDDKYVIKFFKFKHLTPNKFVSFLPSISPFKEYRDNLSIKKNRQLYGMFNGYRLAYDLHKEDSGLVFIHLNRTNDLFPPVTVSNKLGFKQQIDLDKVVFIVQEKASTTHAVLNKALLMDNPDFAKQHIQKIFDLYMSEYQKGIHDKDHDVLNNTGFVHHKPIHLDVGKLIKNSQIHQPEVWQTDIEKIAWKFALWIKKNHPKFYAEISSEIESSLTSLFGTSFEFASRTPPPRNALQPVSK